MPDGMPSARTGPKGFPTDDDRSVLVIVATVLFAEALLIFVNLLWP